MEAESTKKQRHFLFEWSILNLLGWAIGIYFVFKLTDNLEFIKHLAWKYNLATDFRKEWIGETALIWLPLGICIGILQWIELRRFRVNSLSWIFVTAIGFSILFSIYSWVLNFDSFESQRKYAIPYWIINMGLAATMPIGGAIIGSLQSIIIRRFISTPAMWIRAYVLGLSLPAVMAPILYFSKSIFLNIFYSFEFLYMFVMMRFQLFFGFLILVTSLSISISTGKILLKQSNTDSVTTKAG